MTPLKQCSRATNFGAGPAQLPEEVLRQAQDDLIDWRNTGMGILEISHRNAEFQSMMRDSQSKLRQLVHITDDYAVLFMSGGGTLQFAAVVMNSLSKDAIEGTTVDYLITGNWSRKAAEESMKLLTDSNYKVNMINLLDPKTMTLQDSKHWKLSKSPSFIYYCDNETIEGIEFPSSAYVSEHVKSLGINAPLIVDMSSNFLTRPINVTNFDIIFATAQKNFGPAGITVVIVKRLLLTCSYSPVIPIPTMLDYRIFDRNESLYNTPPCFAIYVCGLVFEWLESKFGSLEAIATTALEKANLINDCINALGGFYHCPIPYFYRSRMNIVFRIKGNGEEPDSILEEQFIKEAERSGLYQLRGHRSIGGIRVSLYNAISLEDTKKVVTFMKKFQKTHHNQ